MEASTTSTSIDLAQPAAAQPTPQGEPAKVTIVTDAREPQVNGVVRTLIQARRELEAMGHIVDMITPLEFKTVSCPTYPEIRLSIPPSKHVRERIEKLAPQALRIATEGPPGLAARAYVLRHKLPYMTVYHTRLPEYVQAHFGVPLAWTYRFLRWFHGLAQAVMAPTPVVLKNPADYDIINGALWTRGVDLDISITQRSNVLNTTHSIFLYVGRMAVEKNVEAFLGLDPPDSRWVVGESPALAGLRAKYPNASRLGALKQPELVKVHVSADVFVFPSRIDTFGLALPEALVSGLLVVAYPVTGPIDVLGDSPAGALREDLREACLEALHTGCVTVRARVEKFSQRAASEQFLAHLRPMPAASVGNTMAAEPSTVTDV